MILMSSNYIPLYSKLGNHCDEWRVVIGSCRQSLAESVDPTGSAGLAGAARWASSFQSSKKILDLVEWRLISLTFPNLVHFESC